MKKAVNPFIATVFVIAITFGAIFLVLNIGIPAINKAKEFALFNEALQNMKVLDNIIRQVASEGIGSLKVVQIKATGGDYRIISKTNILEFTQLIQSGTIEPGTFVREENLIIAAGANANATEYDFDRDGSNELVLSNEILNVAIQKVGSSSSQVAINTSRNIKMIQFKPTNINITPTDTSVIFDSFIDSRSGTGYSELIKSGQKLVKAEALVVVNTPNLHYEIVYTLNSGADFLIARVQNARYT